MCRCTIKVYGTGNNIRDFIYIDDLVFGIYSALDKGVIGSIYNIGTEIGNSNLEVIEHIAHLLNIDTCKIDIEFMPERIFDVKYNVLNPGKLARDTGWSPRIDFPKGLDLTYQWLKNKTYE